MVAVCCADGVSLHSMQVQLPGLFAALVWSSRSLMSVCFLWKWLEQIPHIMLGWPVLIVLEQPLHVLGPGFVSTSPALMRRMRESKAGFLLSLGENTGGISACLRWSCMYA